MTADASQNELLLDLGELLTAAGVRPVIAPGRVAPSTLHDAHYHLAVVALTFRAYDKGDSANVRILAPWLKLLQFVAARPSLVSNLQRYASARRTRDRASWSLMPRGYLGDQAHDRMVDWLVATGVLTRDQDYLMAGVRYELLVSLAAEVAREGMFENERLVLERLHSIQPSRKLLGGA